MPVIQLRGRPAPRPSAKRKAQRVYAISFDLDTTLAESICGPGYRGCYDKIKAGLAEFGFARVQGSVFFGDESSDAIRCVMAVQALDNRYAWFGRIVRDLRMLRVDEDNDLMPALSNRLRLGDDGRAA